ncbi:MAG TPA: hypothetical protein VGA80_11495 [Flavobacteriaceae bacterium]|jgi:hypothetical protein
MKKKLLLFILPMLLFTAMLQSQTKVWDFGNDNTTWPGSAGVAVDTYVDQLVLVPGSGVTDFGKVNNSSADFSIFSGETYTAFQRFQMAGGSSPSGNLPTKRYLYFTVDGPCTVKIYFKTGSNGATRTLFVSDGVDLITDGSETTNDGTNGDLAILEGTYSSVSGGKLYVYNDPACNLYKIEVSGANVTTPTLGFDDKASPVSTNIKSIGNRIYVSNVKTSTEVNIYSITGALVKAFKTNTDTDFSFKTGLWIASVKTVEGQKAVKLVTQ